GFIKGNLYVLSSAVIKYKAEKTNLMFFPGFRKTDIVLTPVMGAHISGGCLNTIYRQLCIFSSYSGKVIAEDCFASLVTLFTDKLKYALVCYRGLHVLFQQLCYMLFISIKFGTNFCFCLHVIHSCFTFVAVARDNAPYAAAADAKLTGQPPHRPASVVKGYY